MDSVNETLKHLKYINTLQSKQMIQLQPPFKKLVESTTKTLEQ